MIYSELSLEGASVTIIDSLRGTYERINARTTKIICMTLKFY